MKVTAKEIKDLLACKHAADIFVPECKNGPTQSATNLLKLDGWAMKRSWSNPQTIGYEIKVSRSDFLRDDKWPAYLQYCSQFYFVTPPGLIKPDELPADVGLMVTTKNKSRLLTKKKAPPRDVEIPEDLFRYVLMCRATIGGEQGDEGDADYWRDWLETRKVDRSLGRMVSRTLSKEIQSRITDVDSENERLREKIKGFKLVETFCEKLGIPPTKYLSEAMFRRKVKEAETAVPPDVLNLIGRLNSKVESLKDLAEKLNELANEKEVTA